MELGRNRTGSLSCQQASGCLEQRPALSLLDDAALMIFIAAFSQWEHVADFGAVIRTHLDYSSVATVAGSCGYQLDQELLERIQILEAWWLSFERSQREKTRPPITGEDQAEWDPSVWNDEEVN